jgi:hypothetical protein
MTLNTGWGGGGFGCYGTEDAKVEL